MTGINNLTPFIPTFQSQQAKEDALKSAEEKEKLEAQEEAKKKAEEEAKIKAQEQQLEMLREELKNSKEQADAAAEGFESFGKCLTIAQRITRGDNVPMKDMKYLMEHEPDLYKQAIMLRQPNDDPKNYKSVLDEDDTENASDEAIDSSDSPSSTASEIVSQSTSEVSSPQPAAPATE